MISSKTIISIFLSFALCATIAVSQRSSRDILRRERRRETPQRTVQAAPSVLNSTCDQAAYDGVKEALRTIATATEQDRWAARFLRLGFHDCLPRSCDGSIRFELERVANANLEIPLQAVESAVAGTCVGFADAVKIAVVLSMELSGGPTVVCPMGNIADATEANPDDQLPDRNDPFADIVADFTSMGFTLNETLAGNFGAHSLGRFGNNQFTPNPDTFSADFAQFVANGAPASAQGFNALPSDIALFNDPSASDFVRELASDDDIHPDTTSKAYQRAPRRCQVFRPLLNGNPLYSGCPMKTMILLTHQLPAFQK